MSHDPTEPMRRVLTTLLNNTPRTPEQLPEPSWDTEALQRDFSVEGFLAPFVMVRRKADQVRGTLLFQHSPRLYWGFTPDGE